MEDSGLADLRGFQRVAGSELVSAANELGPLFEARVNATSDRWGSGRKLSFGVAALVHPEFEQLRDLCRILKIWECEDDEFLAGGKEQHEQLLFQHDIAGAHVAFSDTRANYVYLDNMIGQG